MVREDRAQVFQPLALTDDATDGDRAVADAYHAALALAEAGDLAAAHRAAEAEILNDDGAAKALRAELRQRIEKGDASPFAFRLVVK